jgi:hypothetical protein
MARYVVRIKVLLQILKARDLDGAFGQDIDLRKLCWLLS